MGRAVRTQYTYVHSLFVRTYVQHGCTSCTTSLTTGHHSLGGQVQKMRGTANATLIAVEIELCGKCFHRRAVVRSVIKRTITESEAQ
jgi:hypothetical protein